MTDEMERLRFHGFFANSPPELTTSRDEFDEHSKFVVLRVNGALAAFGRLTPSEKGLFLSWSRGEAPTPIGAHVMDFGRCVVAPAYRGLDFYDVLVIKGLQYLSLQGFRFAVSAVKVGRYVLESVRGMGWQDAGDPVLGYPNEGGVWKMQFIYFPFRIASDWDWEALLKGYLLNPKYYKKAKL